MLSPAVNLRASLTQLGSRLSSTERTSAPLHLPRWVSRWSVFTSRTLAARESGKFWFWLSGSLGFRKVNARMRAHAEGLLPGAAHSQGYLSPLAQQLWNLPSATCTLLCGIVAQDFIIDMEVNSQHCCMKSVVVLRHIGGNRCRLLNCSTARAV